MPRLGQQGRGASSILLYFTKALLHHTVLKQTSLFSSDSARPNPHPTPSKVQGEAAERHRGFSKGWRTWGCPTPSLPQLIRAHPISLPPLPAPTCDVFAGNYFLQSVCHSRAINILPQFGLSFSLMIYLKKMIPQAKHFWVIITHGKLTAPGVSQPTLAVFVLGAPAAVCSSLQALPGATATAGASSPHPMERCSPKTPPSRRVSVPYRAYPAPAGVSSVSH